MAERTIGWIQDSGSFTNLKNILRAMSPTNEFNRRLREEKIPKYVPDRCGKDDLINAITGDNCNNIPYSLLKGKGASYQLTVEENQIMFGYDLSEAKKIVTKGGRPNAACTGIAQISVNAQKNLPNGNKRPYQADWQVECFLRWGITIGFIDYNKEQDTCKLSDLGKQLIDTSDSSDEEINILSMAYLSYPPIVRVLSLLNQEGHLTKYDIGKQLGFIGEAGFTSIPQNMFVGAYCTESSSKERNKIRQNAEGSSDKYARMIAAWLCDIGWVTKEKKTVTEEYCGIDYTMEIGQAYKITLKGKQNFNRALGKSRYSKVSKSVYWDMLATKAPDKEYLRNRRAHIIKYLDNERTMDNILSYLKQKGFDEDEVTIKDDINNLINIGLNIAQSNNKYRLYDNIINLELPTKYAGVKKSNNTYLKDELRKKLKTLDHKYLILLDLAYDKNECTEFEIQTMDLLNNELHFGGMHLGGASKPDGVVYYGENGVIVDTKAYGAGYSLPMSQADEMIRYIEENKTRGTINSNKWWESFNNNVSKFNYLFVSSEFKSGFKDRLGYIAMRTGINGGAITAENLLLLADKIKSSEVSYSRFFELLNNNDEIVIK